MTRPSHAWITAAAIAAATAISSCSEPSGPRAGAPVQLRAGAVMASSPSASLLSANLTVTSLRVMVGGAGLGHGDQFGCIDCQGSEENAGATPRWVDIPVSKGTVLLETEMAAPGSYSEMEVELRRATGSSATIELAGEYNGTSFNLAFDVAGNSRHTLSQPIVVTQQSANTVSATLEFPVQAWFTGAGGAELNPLDPAGRSAIEANLRAYFVNETEKPEGGRE